MTEVNKRMCDTCGLKDDTLLIRKSMRYMANTYADGLFNLNSEPQPGSSCSYTPEVDFCSGSCAGVYMENIAYATCFQNVSQALGDMWRYNHPDPVKARRALKVARGQAEPKESGGMARVPIEVNDATP